MEENMMQAPQAPQMEQGNPEEMLQQQVMQVADEIIQEWKDTGMIQGKKITDEKEAKRLAVAMALRMVEEEAQMAEREQMAPQQAPQGPPPTAGQGVTYAS